MSGRRLLALSLSLAALIGAWAYQSPARATYALGVEQALARWAAANEAPSARIRVTGYLVPGSLSRGKPCGARFIVRGAPGDPAPAELRVELTGCLPAVLCDLPGVDSEVTVEGRLDRADGAPVFEADALLAKCAAKYAVPEVRSACARASAEERRLCSYCGHALRSGAL